MSDNARWVRPLGSASAAGWDVAIDESVDSWEHTRLYAVTLAAGESRTVPAADFEHIVVPLRGSVSVTVVDPEGVSHDALLAGRASVFAGASDVAYATRDCEVTVTAEGGAAKVAVCGARASRRHTPPLRHVGVADVPVELRGAGIASREVRNFGTPAVLEADSIIACEVLTPGGNWSSYPPHKHDEDRPGIETDLEEVYYFEVAPEAGSPAAAGTDPVGYQRVYGTDERPIDVLVEVRSGDVVLVPHGWHGPAMAAPGYDLYYLNVMAGPGTERSWLICDDPAHGWVRDTWATQQVDPRLPFGGAQ
ncbi:5-deoxy-glucuronate isomerase [Humibacillus xanthopallidus]|uniref:5-deoxyglucuronate isomerase n=1 Tax=Humibacillus xanthopallidus TaxID=412689 RepID=A0A543I2U1_9MICO|nr:5-deoxy-glucuronate isomerase [Humibacillus xanthopallidus]TQM64861.1 5-deoxyglucuronate isomerase [Humibacillus xanthopallidus]